MAKLRFHEGQRVVLMRPRSGATIDVTIVGATIGIHHNIYTVMHDSGDCEIVEERAISRDIKPASSCPRVKLAFENTLLLTCENQECAGVSASSNPDSLKLLPLAFGKERIKATRNADGAYIIFDRPKSSLAAFERIVGSWGPEFTVLIQKG